MWGIFVRNRAIIRIMRRFVIVTPCRNAVDLIDDTIASVVTQCGPFALRYHLQDGGSTDGTVDRLRAWDRALAGGGLPSGPAGGIELTWESVPDGGLYDAIERGFQATGAQKNDWMGWINASDRLAPSALATVRDVLRTDGSIRWLGGRTAHINGSGSLVRVEDAIGYPRRSLAAGLHDGRHLPFVQQEGCFWSAALWSEAGGRLDASLRAAGDFELWRRFAGCDDFVTVDTLLGCFRRHPGQISGDLAGYYREVERLLANAPAEREAVWSLYGRLSNPKDHGGLAEAGFMGPVMQYDPRINGWRRLSRPPFPIR